MRIYNTLSGQKEEFIPLVEGKVSIYVCGPTVYDFIHIGNARPMIVFDTLRRYLESQGLEVNYTSNFTDVDDKIIHKAILENVPFEEVSQRFIKECEADMKALNIMPATHAPKASEEIDGMIEMVSTLIDKGYAYEKGGTVYYKTRAFEGYGKLSKKNIDDLEAGKRINIEEQKEDPMDFVLWKPKKEGEPAWQSPWGEGRPGWHLECSEMSRKYLGEEIDIHAGGEDLVFPHHENEIAQSEACSGKQFARYWMHNAFLTIDKTKMSKSLGNFFTVRDICEQYSPEVLRFFMLNAHYRSPLNFSAEMMEMAKTSLERIWTAVDNIDYLLQHTKVDEISSDEKELLATVQDYEQAFILAMEDDLNTATAISGIFDLVRFANSQVNGESSKEFLNYLQDKMIGLMSILGLKYQRKIDILDSEIESLIEERSMARKNRDFKKADEIRDLLLAKGIVLEDTREGVKWKHI